LYLLDSVSPFLLHRALASYASAYCSDDLAIIFDAFSPKDPRVNIYVSNLAYSATDHDIRQLFESYGVVDKINVITDRDTGQSRGFGFVEMPDSAAAKAAIQGLQGKELGGRSLTLDEARPREPRREPRQARW